jgi:hypothetical protein
VACTIRDTDLGMNTIPSKALALSFALGLAFLCVASQNAGGGRETTNRLKLNKDAIEHVKRLIAAGHIVADKHGSWKEHRPSPEQENEFIRAHGFDEYAKWHLGIDERRPLNTKARYKFPCGDFKDIHRCALLAVQNRAKQFNHPNIETAAISLRKMMETQAALDSKQ